MLWASSNRSTATCTVLCPSTTSTGINASKQQGNNASITTLPVQNHLAQYKFWVCTKLVMPSVQLDDGQGFFCSWCGYVEIFNVGNNGLWQRTMVWQLTTSMTTIDYFWTATMMQLLKYWLQFVLVKPLWCVASNICLPCQWWKRTVHNANKIWFEAQNGTT